MDNRDSTVIQFKKAGKWMSLCCAVEVDYKWVNVMDGIKFDFTNIISLYTKSDSLRRRVVSLGYYILPVNYIVIIFKKKCRYV